MTKWEYCTVYWHAAQSAQDDMPESAAYGQLRYYVEATGTASTFTDLSVVLTRLGSEGWEMVSHAHMNADTSFFFKRPIG